jgi:hypothetical protein
MQVIQPPPLNPIGLAIGQGLMNGINSTLQGKAGLADSEALLQYLSQLQRAQQYNAAGVGAPDMPYDVPGPTDWNTTVAMPQLKTPQMQSVLMQLTLGQIMNPMQQSQIRNLNAETDYYTARAGSEGVQEQFSEPFQAGGKTYQYGPDGKLHVVDTEEKQKTDPQYYIDQGYSRSDALAAARTAAGLEAGAQRPTVSSRIADQMGIVEQRIQQLKDAGYADDSPAVASAQARWDELAKLSSASTNVELKMMPEGMVSRQANREALMRVGEEVISKWRPEYTGPIQGWMTSLKNKWVGGDQQAASFEAGVTSMIEQMYQKAGKQLSDEEMKRWDPFIPKMTEPDSTFKAKMDNLMNNVTAYLSAESDVASRAGYRTTDSQRPVEQKPDPLGLR